MHQPRPDREAGGVNLYAFVNNSPTNGVDEYGLDPEQEAIDEASHGGPGWAVNPTPTPEPPVPEIPMLWGSQNDPPEPPPPATSVPELTDNSVWEQCPASPNWETFEKFLMKARERYPKRIGEYENHHITPQYLGGPEDGPTVPLEIPYHKVITKAFRDEYKYGQSKLPLPDELARIMMNVYSEHPLPPAK